MARAGAITFKGNPMTLLGSELNVGSAAPEFKIHFFEGGLKTITLADLKGKPTFISVVPSLDTGTCQIQTKKFNVELAGMGDKVNALTVSRDLPFAMNRFCGAEDIKSMKVGSDYQDGNFGLNFGLVTIDGNLSRLVLGATTKLNMSPENRTKPSSRDWILDRVLVRVADDVGGSARSLDGNAPDPFPKPILDDPDRVLAAFQQQRHDRDSKTLD